MKNVLLISEKTLKEYTLVNDNIDGMYILPAIKMAQDVDLDNAIGPVLNKKLQALVAEGTISDDSNAKYKKLLDDYITPYMCWLVMSAVQLNINFKLSNSGVISNQDDRKNAIDYRSGKELIAQYEKYANAYGQKLKNFLCAHSNEYPEYKQCENYEREDELQLCSIYLGDVNYNKHCYIGK